MEKFKTRATRCLVGQNIYFQSQASLIEPGVRETLKYIQNLISELKICSLHSGKHVVDWIFPDEWTIRNAFNDDSDENRLVDFKNNNQHGVGFSESLHF